MLIHQIGYWYYYNGTNWVQGGVYQASSVTANISEIKDEIEQINGNINIDDLFEVGNISISNQGWIYGESTTRIRLKENTTIHLKVGDVFSISNEDVQMYCGYLMRNGRYETLENAWVNNGFTCRIEGDYVMVLRFIGEQEPISSVNDITQYIKIQRNNNINQINQINNILKDNNSYIKQRIINDMDQGGYAAGSGFEMYSYGKLQNTRFSHKDVILSDTPIVIEMLNGYEIACHRWSSPTKSTETLIEDSGWQKQIIVNSNEYTTFQIRNSTNSIIDDINFSNYMNIYYFNEKFETKTKKSTINSVNHRGYNSVAPENTLPAFKLSKVNGFDIIETDVRLTSDGVPVLLHDATIDRTSNGVGSISSMTYEQVSQYDFGSWKSEEYAGTKIPMLEELISLARDINLHCYLELESDVNFTSEKINEIIEMIKSYKMLEKVTFLSFNINLLLLVKSINKDVRLGYLPANNENYLRSISKLQSLKTKTNEIFYDGDFTALNDSKVNRLKLLNIPYEVWVPYTAQQIIDMNPYVTGFTTNVLNAENVLYNNAIN